MNQYSTNRGQILYLFMQTLLETLDAGKTWTPRYLNTGDDLPYRYSSISFKENEGWLVGKPPILMHTTDAGKSWERIGLSPQLPGIPLVITALNNQGGAEMCTDQVPCCAACDCGRCFRSLWQPWQKVEGHEVRKSMVGCFLLYRWWGAGLRKMGRPDFLQNWGLFSGGKHGSLLRTEVRICDVHDGAQLHGHCQCTGARSVLFFQLPSVLQAPKFEQRFSPTSRTCSLSGRQCCKPPCPERENTR